MSLGYKHILLARSNAPLVSYDCKAVFIRIHLIIPLYQGTHTQLHQERGEIRN